MSQEIPHVIAKAVPFHYVEGQVLVALVAQPLDDSRSWQLPDARVYNSHTSLQYLEQALRTQCGMTPRNVRYREQLYTFESPSPEDISKNTLSLTYLYLSSELLWHKGSKHIGLFPIDKLPNISFLDRQIIQYAVERLRSKALYTTLPGFLLPPAFTLDQYQQVFESLSGKKVDRRNFRKKLRKLNILTAATDKNTSHYSLTESHLSILMKPF